MTPPEPFRIDVSQETLDDLAARLDRARWPDEIAGVDWQEGASLAYMRALVHYWRRGFDWRRVEAELNRFAHYRASIGGLAIHFLHERGRGPSPLPLVVTHGWPGSFAEMTKLLPRLTDPTAHGGEPGDAFDVVVPSLPGYGFSDRPLEPGTNVWRIGDLWAELMSGLGYPRFGAVGGDIGAGVSTVLGLRHADRVVGVHLNYIPGSYRPDLEAAAALAGEEEAFLARAGAWYDAEGAYSHLHRTRPQTAAFALNDSPIGLAAWLVEKFQRWADCDGDVERRFTKDELLTHVMIYWATGTIHSSMRLYLEGRLTPLHFGRGESVRVPCGIAHFPKEAPFPPRPWVDRGYRVVRWTEMPRGGHFAAFEEPDLLAEDIRAFFRPLRAELSAIGRAS